ncbi:MAG: hypothetical protein KKC73_09640, partial [Proteobacteria bacterium]|nr:hypothetical protein [Pseudomonadota bacterium]
NTVSRHSGESRTRSEALALSSPFKQLQTIWTPVFTGVTNFYKFIKFVLTHLLLLYIEKSNKTFEKWEIVQRQDYGL